MKIDEYQGRLNQEPIREQQLADLNRGYDQSKANYDDLLKKEERVQDGHQHGVAATGRTLPHRRSPSYPQRPEFPNRLKFCAMGLASARAWVCSSPGPLSSWMTACTTQRHSQAAAGGSHREIPAIVNTSDAHIATRKVWIGWATAGVVLLPY